MKISMGYWNFKELKEVLKYECFKS